MVFDRVKAGLIFMMLAAAMIFAAMLHASPAWAAAQLTVDKTDSPDPVKVGDKLTYKIVVKNTGKDPAKQVKLKDVLDPSLNFISAETSDGGTCTESGGTVTCKLDNIAPGESTTVTIEVRPTKTGPVTNTATATSSNSGTADDTITTRVVPDLEINKLDDPDPASTQGDLLYTLRVQNQGDTTVNNIGVTDDLPLTDVDFVALDSNDFDCIYTAGAVQCTNGSLGPGEIGKVEIIVEPEVVGRIQNRADVFVQGIDAPVDTDVESTLVKGAATGGTTGGTTGTSTTGSSTTGSSTTGSGATDTTGGTTGTDNPSNVVPGSVPDQTLADTGGGSVITLMAGLLIVGGGLFFSAYIRREP